MPSEAYRENTLQRFARTRGYEFLKPISEQEISAILGGGVAMWGASLMIAVLWANGWMWALFSILTLAGVFAFASLVFIYREVERKLAYDQLVHYQDLAETRLSHIMQLGRQTDVLLALLRLYQLYVDEAIDAQGLLDGVRRVKRMQDLDSEIDDDAPPLTSAEEFERFVAASVEDIDEAIRRELYGQQNGS